jgi:hypothetical protein
MSDVFLKIRLDVANLATICCLLHFLTVSYVFKDQVCHGEGFHVRFRHVIAAGASRESQTRPASETNVTEVREDIAKSAGDCEVKTAGHC